MKQQYRRLMTHKITIEKLDRDYTGKLVPVETTENVPAFVQYGSKLVTDREGEETVAGAVVFLLNDAPINPTHKHWRITQTHPYSRGPMSVIIVDPIDDPRTGKTHHFEAATK